MNIRRKDTAESIAVTVIFLVWLMVRDADIKKTPFSGIAPTDFERQR